VEENRGAEINSRGTENSESNNQRERTPQLAGRKWYCRQKVGHAMPARLVTAPPRPARCPCTRSAVVVALRSESEVPQAETVRNKKSARGAARRMSAARCRNEVLHGRQSVMTYGEVRK